MSAEQAEKSTISGEEIQERLAEAYQTYVRAVNNAWIPEDTRARLEESHREFVRAVQETWARVDVSELDANTLTSMSQTLMQAAWMAAAMGIR